MNESISIIIPVYNEQESLRELFNEISATLNEYCNWEIIFIDDGSSDKSAEILHSIIEENDNITMIRFFKNFGKADALSEGFQAAQGEYVITMDADLQDDPAEIPNLISKLKQNWDMVSGWKIDRKDPLVKRYPSKFFNLITRLFTGLNLHDFNCGLKGYRNSVVKAVELYGGLHRYIPALAKQKGFSVTEIPVNHRPRKFGETKYGGARFFHGLFDLLTVLFIGNYLRRPLHFFGIIGLGLFLAGFGILGWLTWGWFNGIWIGDRPVFFLGLLFLILSAQFFSIGLLGDIMVRLSGQNRNRVLETVLRNKK
tara:strand:+ start:1986 stop:2921 length:936 start_codon:yes stop_codon:yes gene_type:complete